MVTTWGNANKTLPQKSAALSSTSVKAYSDPETTVVAPTGNTDMASQPGNAHVADRQ